MSSRVTRPHLVRSLSWGQCDVGTSPAPAPLKGVAKGDTSIGLWRPGQPVSRRRHFLIFCGTGRALKAL